MIKSFRGKEAEKLWGRRRSAKLPFNIQSKSRDKLAQIDAAIQVEDLRFPPGNRLEALSGDRAGQFSIRINLHVARQARRWSALRAGSERLPEAGTLWAMKEQWRICFRWETGNAYDVEIIDYH